MKDSKKVVVVLEFTTVINEASPENSGVSVHLNTYEVDPEGNRQPAERSRVAPELRSVVDDLVKLAEPVSSDEKSSHPELSTMLELGEMFLKQFLTQERFAASRPEGNPAFDYFMHLAAADPGNSNLKNLALIFLAKVAGVDNFKYNKELGSWEKIAEEESGKAMSASNFPEPGSDKFKDLLIAACEIALKHMSDKPVEVVDA